jgi:homoserine dehydrogenase
MISLLFVGFGHVARRFVRLLDESRESLEALEIKPRIVGIATRRLGCWSDPSGLAPRAVIEATRDERLPDPTTTASMADWIGGHHAAPHGIHVLIETTTLDVAAGEPAISHVRAGLTAGLHVVTANKGPVAFAYKALAAEAAGANRLFLFEGAVMDGVPVFSLVREACPALDVLGFRGVVNSTTNHILTALGRGEAFAPALARMQTEGVAEADASLDLDGWDAAAKTAALANVWLDAGITPHDVRREGISANTGARVRAAQAAGRRLKLVAWAQRRGDRVDAAVELQDLTLDDPLAILEGSSNALEIDTWPLGRIVITQRDGGLEKTAYALLADLVTVARSVRRDR